MFELGHRAFECLEGELELIGVQLLGLLPVHQPAQLSHQVFQAPIAIGQRGEFDAKLLEHRSAVLALQMAVALGERHIVGAKLLERRVLRFEQCPNRWCKRTRMDCVGARLHDVILS